MRSYQSFIEEGIMAEEDLTRRDAVGLLIKATLITTAIPHIFLAQTTFAQNLKMIPKTTPLTKPPDPKDLLKPTKEDRVVIAAQGSQIVFTIMGPPGRHCRVNYAVKGSNAYVTAPGGAGVIGSDGRLTLSVNVQQFDKQQLLFGVQTSQSGTFDRELRATTPFEVSIQNREVHSITGIRERNTIGQGIGISPQAAAASFSPYDAR
jgi:hypothetical protein